MLRNLGKIPLDHHQCLTSRSRHLSDKLLGLSTSRSDFNAKSLVRTRKAKTGRRHEQAMGNHNGFNRHCMDVAQAPRRKFDPVMDGMTDWIPGELGGRTKSGCGSTWIEFEVNAGAATRIS